MSVYSGPKGQVPSVDARDAIRQVILSGVPFWQASSGRTFPVVAGAEDPPPADPNNQTGDDGDEHEDEFDKDRALATIRKQREREKANAAALRTATAELEALKVRQKERDDAELSETERLKAKVAEQERLVEQREAELKESRTRAAVEREAAKANATDPDDVYRLLNHSEFEYDGDGKLTNGDKLVAALIKAKPYLAGKTTGSGVPASPRSNGTPGRDEKVGKLRDELRASGNYEI